MTVFKLNVCKLFERYPLYNYCTSSDSGENKKLQILLIGYGSRMDTILQQILSNGQLLNTDLEVTVANTNASGTYESFMKKAPYLEHFSNIFVNSKMMSASEKEDPFCTLHFDNVQLSPEAMPEVLLNHCECSYIIISTGNDEKNYTIAESCAQFIADHNTVIAYVQKKGTDKIEVMSPLSETYAFGSTKEDTYRKQLEQIALNLHFAYAKSQNERANIEQIINDFQEPYNYVSNIEAAVHIRSKLACVGINDESLDAAAEKFSKLITDSPEIVDQLSVLEHKRWMMEKILQGYRQLEDLNLIYSRRGISTHDSTEKWHCCLVSCDPTGKSHIEPQDWKYTGKVSSMTHLDSLDQMSIQLHRKCEQIAQTNRPRVMDLLKTIKGAITGHLTFSEETLDAANRMELAISQMYQQKRSAIHLYERDLNTLKSAVSSEGKLQAFMLTEHLDLLDSALAPLKEFISFKDYKRADRDFIKKIPFVLSHKIKPALVKLLSTKDIDNVFSLWNLEPENVTFIGCASDSIEIMQIRQQADNICNFVNNAELTTKLSWHLIVPEHISDIKKTNKELFKGWNCTIHSISTVNRSSLTTTVREIFTKIPVDYMDITGADPFFSRSAEVSAENNGIPIFYTKNGRIFNLVGASELEYESPKKELTVHEMFLLAGAVLEENETEKLSDLSKKYDKFWQIAQNTENWHVFCEHITNAYNQTPKPHKTFTLSNIQESFVKTSLIVKSDVITALIPTIKKLVSIGFVQNLNISHEGDNQRNITFKAPGAKLAANIRYGLIELCEQYTSSSFFTVKSDADKASLILCDLSVKNMELPAENRGEYHQILEKLASNKIILNLTQDNTGKYSFIFSSMDVLNAFQMSGRVLEYYLYYSALLDGYFTDVNMGWKFLHSSSENSAENELDVVCTKGTSSLFISAKMVSAKTLKSNNKLNYTFYEISLLADRFGINAKPVLAAPQLPQFTVDEQGNRTLSAEVHNALRRGVYLLGRECFQDGKLGKILDNIIDGKEDWYNC